MRLKIDDIRNNAIYLESKGTLSKRIDFAWSIYTNSNEKKDDRKKALYFLVNAFDLDDLTNLRGQLIALMEKKQKYQHINDEYIPTKEPRNLSFNPAEVSLQKIPYLKSHPKPEISEAIKKRELLDMGLNYKKLGDSAYYFNNEERASMRVDIRDGVFVKNGKNFDTESMYSKGKDGYAAFTLNANGELSVFSHRANRLFHSSMNAGAPVIAASELKIEDGVLTAITTESGHYRPSLFSIYRLLEHFSFNRVDINPVSVFTFNQPSACGIQCISNYNNGMFETPANQIYSSMKTLIDKNIGSIQTVLKNYKDSGFINAVYGLKDLLTGSDLTEKRTDLATRFEAEITAFKRSFRKGMSVGELQPKIDELDVIIKKFEKENNKLSIQYGKNENSGRIAEKMDNFKQQLNDLKQNSQTPDVEPLETISTMKKIC